MKSISKKKLWWFAAGLVAMSAGMSAPSYAQGWYAGASYGQASSDDVADSLTAAYDLVLGVTPNVDDSDSAWKVYGGYQFNQNFAVEFGYANLGEITASGGGVTTTVETTGFSAFGVGLLPVADRVNLFGKVGLIRWDADVSATSAIASATGSDSGTDIAFGAGASFDFTKNVAARVEWERFDVDDGDYDLLSAGLVFRF